MEGRQKGLNLGVTGECFESVFYDPHAIGAVVQGILDNMVKYAPSGSRAVVNFDVMGDRIQITFSSLGPKIFPHEMQSIFALGVRGEAARNVESTGHGVGLATAQQISEVLELSLSVSQSPDQDVRFPAHYSTTFRVELRSQA